jgi:holo-[acyl-carrier protein] synthase
MIETMGIGIDIIKVNKFRNMPFEKESLFYKKIFLPSEIKYCLKYTSPYEHFAGKFAIKEAVKKSINEKIPMLSIETSHSNSKPTVTLLGNWQKKYQFLASISHEKEFAVGMIVSEKLI